MSAKRPVQNSFPNGRTGRNEVCYYLLHISKNCLVEESVHEHAKNVETVEQAGNDNFLPGDNKLLAEKKLTAR